MSDRSEPKIWWRRIIGCLVFGLILVPSALFSLGFALLGQCNWEGDCIPPFEYSLLFPGLLLFAVIGTALLALWVVKDGR